MFIIACHALEIIPLFFIMLLRTSGEVKVPLIGDFGGCICLSCRAWGLDKKRVRLYKLFRSRDMGRAVAVRRWTPTALECYKRGCNCEGCFYRDFFSGSSQKCQMKASVLELVRVIGTPNIELQQFILED